MESTSEVRAVQNSLEELKKAISKIKNDNDLILYTNIVSKLQIGNKIITDRQFNTILCSEENDILLMLMQDGVASVEDIKSLLDKRNFCYHEVCFSKNPFLKKEHEEIPELHFIRDKSMLEEVFFDSVINGFYTCHYYPNVIGRLYLDYLSTFNETNNKIEGRFFKGIIRFDDKLLLLINNRYYHGITFKGVVSLAYEYGINCLINNDKYPNINEIKKKTRTISK